MTMTKSPTSQGHFVPEVVREPARADDAASEVLMSFADEDEMSAEAVDSMSLDASRGRCAVPDTACRRTLIGQYTLRSLERHLLNPGHKIIRRKDRCTFEFGNAGTLTSKEVVLISAQIGSQRLVIRAYVLPSTGKWTPLLLSKEFLGSVGAIVDLDSDRMFSRNLVVRFVWCLLHSHVCFSLECQVVEGFSQHDRVSSLDKKENDMSQLEKI